jgi:acyl dehydratase
VPDETWGEVGRAIVVLREGVVASAAEILDHVRQRLAGYKVPKSVVFADALPRSGAGKLLKNALRDIYSGRIPGQKIGPEDHGGNAMTTTTVHGAAELLAAAGRHLGYSDWLEITQERIDTFADATDDHQWIHCDPARAAEGPFGTTIAHGYLTLSLVVPLIEEILVIEGKQTSINYGLDKVRFPAPVPVGSKLRMGATLAEATEIPAGVQVALDCTIEIDGAERPACVARAVLRHLF